jgi:tRNA-specific 2-thiouridylase
VALGEAVYVREIRPATNTLVIGDRDEMAQRTFSVGEGRWIAGEPPGERFACSVRIRHRAPDVPCDVTLMGSDRLAVETDEAVWAPAPGQAAVFYRDDECLGGGRITPN